MCPAVEELSLTEMKKQSDGLNFVIIPRTSIIFPEGEA